MKGLRFTMPTPWHTIMVQLIESGSFCTMADCMRTLFREGQAQVNALWESEGPTKDDLKQLFTHVNLNEHPTTVNLSPDDWTYFTRFDLYPKYIINLCFYYALKKRKLIKKDGTPS